LCSRSRGVKLPSMKLRNILLTGLALCVLTLVSIAFRNSDFRHLLLREPSFLAIMTLVLVWNAYAAIRWTHARTSEDSMVLETGVKWGLAIGCAWGLVAIVPVHVFTPNDEVGAPLWFLGLFSGILLPFASGAAGAIKTGSVQIGRRVGFWSGVVGSLMGFLVFAILEFASGTEFALVAAFNVMFIFGSLYSGVAGMLGGWIGLKLYRTGEPPVGATPSIPS
jgi:hypothetical protein